MGESLAVVVARPGHSRLVGAAGARDGVTIRRHRRLIVSAKSATLEVGRIIKARASRAGPRRSLGATEGTTRARERTHHRRGALRCGVDRAQQRFIVPSREWTRARRRALARRRAFARAWMTKRHLIDQLYDAEVYDADGVVGVVVASKPIRR